MDFKLELIPVAVSDVDRAKAFYEQAGFVVDNDVRVKEGLRFIQLTPPHSRRLGFDALLPLSPEKSSGRGEELVDVVKQGVARPALRAPHGAEAIRHLEPDAVLAERHPTRRRGLGAARDGDHDRGAGGIALAVDGEPTPTNVRGSPPRRTTYAVPGTGREGKARW
jgi:hypothetical protein